MTDATTIHCNGYTNGPSAATGTQQSQQVKEHKSDFDAQEAAYDEMAQEMTQQKFHYHHAPAMFPQMTGYNPYMAPHMAYMQTGLVGASSPTPMAFSPMHGHTIQQAIASDAQTAMVGASNGGMLPKPEPRVINKNALLNDDKVDDSIEYIKISCYGDVVEIPASYMPRIGLLQYLEKVPRRERAKKVVFLEMTKSGFLSIMTVLRDWAQMSINKGKPEYHQTIAEHVSQSDATQTESAIAANVFYLSDIGRPVYQMPKRAPTQEQQPQVGDVKDVKLASASAPVVAAELATSVAVVDPKPSGQSIWQPVVRTNVPAQQSAKADGAQQQPPQNQDGGGAEEPEFVVRVCKKFVTNRGCSFKDNCKYVHSRDDPEFQPVACRNTKNCWHFKRGICGFLHDGQSAVDVFDAQVRAAWRELDYYTPNYQEKRQ